MYIPAKIFSIINQMRQRTSEIVFCSEFSDFEKLKSGEFLGSYNNPGFMGNKFKRETIWLRIDETDPVSISVLFHELAHATGIFGRLARPGMAHFNLLYRTEIVKDAEEIIAESVAARLMEHFKLSNQKTRESSRRYIERYKRVFLPCDFYPNVKSTEKEIEQAFHYILDHWVPDAQRLERELQAKMREIHGF